MGADHVGDHESLMGRKRTPITISSFAIIRDPKSSPKEDRWERKKWKASALGETAQY